MARMLQCLVVAVILSIASAYPYIEELRDGPDGEYVQLVPLRRVPRAVPRPNREKFIMVPAARGGEEELVGVSSNKEPITAETGYGHSSHPYDYVDYGAYTGGYGAFGWYSDHPVYTYGHSSY